MPSDEPLLVLCGHCQVEMTTLPSGSRCCPKCGRFAAKIPAKPPVQTP